MAKAKKSVFFCQNCGHEESKWLGQCPMCKEWNSFVEECVTTSNTAAVKAAKEIRIVPLSEVKTENEERVTTEIKELDRVLGGGIVPGIFVDPGVGGERMKAVKKKLWTGWIRIQKILTEKDGISTVELILVLVVIIGLVIIFKKQLNELVTKIFEKITNESSGI